MIQNQTMLLVDDCENDIFLMRTAFKKGEVTWLSHEAKNGEVAIAYLKGEGVYSDRSKYPLPSIVLLDLNMPMKDGFEVLAWARTQPAFKSLSIIVLTASMRTEDVERAFALGANGYLVKPGSLSSLVAMVRCLQDWIRINHFPPLNGTVVR